MKTYVTGFILTGIAAVIYAVIEHAYAAAAMAFCTGMYFGLIIAERKPTVTKYTNGTGPGA